jgi:hypothetical protein
VSITTRPLDPQRALPITVSPAPDVDVEVDVDIAVDVDVAILRWPEDDALRVGLAALGRPRILLVDDGIAPPEPVDHLEDWLRWPPDPDELAVRSRSVSRRALPVEHAPVVDEDGLLRRGERWIAVSDAQLPVVHLLVDHLDRVVRFDTIVAAYAANGGSDHGPSVRTMLSRLDARVRPLGLGLRSVRRRGVVLHSITP